MPIHDLGRLDDGRWFITMKEIQGRTLRELIAQRTRIWTGHQWLRQRTGYAVATYRIRDLIGPALTHLRVHPRSAPTLLLAALIELWSRSQGARALLRRREEGRLTCERNVQRRRRVCVYDLV